MKKTLLILRILEKLINSNFTLVKKIICLRFGIKLLLFRRIRYSTQQRISNDDTYANQLPNAFKKTFANLPEHLHTGAPEC